MPDLTRNPRVAFGMMALHMHLAAKAGTATRRDGADMTRAAQRWLPADERAADAAAHFAATVTHDDAAAAQGLDDFLTRWLSPEEIPDWHSRKDCGHD